MTWSKSLVQFIALGGTVLCLAATVAIIPSCGGAHRLPNTIEGDRLKALMIIQGSNSYSLTDDGVLKEIGTALNEDGSGSQVAREAFPGRRRVSVDYKLSYGENDAYAYQGVLYETDAGEVHLLLFFAEDGGFQGDREIFVNLARLLPIDANRIKEIFFSTGE